MEMNFNIDYIIKGNNEEPFETEDALFDFLEEKSFDCFKVKEFLFLDLSDGKILIFTEKENRFSLTHIFDSPRLMYLTSFIMDNFDLDYLFPRDIQPITVTRISGVGA